MNSLDFRTGQKVAQQLDRRIQNIAKEAYADTPKNSMKFGRVTAVNGAFCTLSIDGKEYPNVPLYRSVGALKVGDVVDCVIPNGNFSNIRVVGIADGTLSEFTYSGIVGSDNSGDVIGWYEIGVIDPMGSYDDYNAMFSISYTYAASGIATDALVVMRVRTAAGGVLESASLKIISSNHRWDGVNYSLGMTTVTLDSKLQVKLYAYIPYQYQKVKTTILTQSSRSLMDKYMKLNYVNTTKTYTTLPSESIIATSDGMLPIKVYSTETVSNGDSRTAPVSGYAKLVPFGGFSGIGWMSIVGSSGILSVIDNQPAGSYPQVYIPVTRGDSVTCSWGNHNSQMILSFIQASV